jgi:hypothetical protein
LPTSAINYHQRRKGACRNPVRTRRDRLHADIQSDGAIDYRSRSRSDSSSKCLAQRNPPLTVWRGARRRDEEAVDFAGTPAEFDAIVPDAFSFLPRKGHIGQRKLLLVVPLASRKRRQIAFCLAGVALGLRERGEIAPPFLRAGAGRAEIEQGRGSKTQSARWAANFRSWKSP